MRRRFFKNRSDAGRQLAAAIQSEPVDRVILGLPRGGVSVAAEVAGALGAPLDVIVVRKLSVPTHPELAVGAIASGVEARIIRNDSAIEAMGISDQQLEDLRAREAAALQHRVNAYRATRSPVQLAGRQAVIVDDGMATGSTARAAVMAARWRDAGSVIIATPVASPEAARRVAAVADDVICLHTPVDFRSVGEFYEDFRQVTDDEVTALLAHEGDA